MMNNLQNNAPEQRTDDWKKMRLGHFSGSCMGKLMVSSRKKDEIFGGTAMDYIYKVASERTLKQAVLDNEDALEEYENLTSVWSRPIQHGIDWESDAIKMYEIKSQTSVTECSSINHPTIPYLSASPDGIIEGEQLGVIECKCPIPSTFMKYVTEINDNASLKKVNSDYYWQTQTEMLVTGAKYCDFVVFSPFQQNPIKVVRITPDADAQQQIEERVTEANKLINTIINENGKE